MNRRDFLKFLLTTPIAATMDLEKLLWVPKPIIVVPAMPRALTMNQILEAELNRITPRIMRLFERDNMFYGTISKWTEVEK